MNYKDIKNKNICAIIDRYYNPFDRRYFILERYMRSLNAGSINIQVGLVSGIKNEL